MLPAERGEVSEWLVRNILGLAQSGNGALEVPRVPQDDCGHEEVQAGSAVLLVLVGAVADLAEAMLRVSPLLSSRLVSSRLRRTRLFNRGLGNGSLRRSVVARVGPRQRQVMPRGCVKTIVRAS